MSQRITIRFPADRDNDFYFRVFCWVDDTLYPAINMNGLDTVHDVDHLREVIRIDVHKTRHLGEVLALIKKSLAQHFPDGEGSIIRGES